MKKIFFLILLYSLSVSYLNAQTLVTEEEAIAASMSYLIENGGNNTIRSMRIDSAVFSRDNNVLLYFVSNNDSIYYVVPGTKCLPRILAVINRNSDENLYSNSNYWIEYYKDAAYNSISIKDIKIHSSWNKNQIKNTSNTEVIGPLMTSRWRQDASNSGGDRNAYNYYVTSYCEDCGNYEPVGCVAVAMGQIMNYWKFPYIRYQKSAEHFYDWCNMSDDLNVSSNNYLAEKKAIARLLYDCGIAANMNYCYMNDCASFAWPVDAKNAFKDEFGYSNDIDIIRRSFHSDDVWKLKIKEEIMSLRPVFYAALETDTDDFIPSNGHAFVCDGYNPNLDLFHFNMGWGGHNDGWYCIDNLTVGLYDMGVQRAIVNIHPSGNTYSDFCGSTIKLNDYYQEYYINSNHTRPEPYNNVPYVAGHLVSAFDGDGTTTFWNTIPNGASSEYLAHKSVTLRAGFHARRGADFVARIIPCNNCQEEGLSDQASYCNYQGLDDYEASTDSAMSLVLEDYERYPNLDVIYPNPCYETITCLGVQVADLSIFDLSGRPVYRWYVQSNFGNKLVVNVSDLKPAVYIIVLKYADNTIIAKKIVKI